MIEITGNIWDYHKDTSWVVIPTNKQLNKKGDAVMGAGLALQATKKFPLLARSYGDWLAIAGRDGVVPFREIHLIMFPTKIHWKDDSDLTLIEHNARELVKWVNWLGRCCYLPRLGCGLGKLSWEKQVQPLLASILDNRFYVVNNVK